MHFKDKNGGLHFLSDEDIANGGMALLPSGCVEITDEEAEAIRAAEISAIPKQVPQQVTRLQALASLHLAGLLTTVEAMMADPATDTLTVLAWKNAQEFKRTSPMVLNMAQALGLSDEQLDNLFVSASQIE